MMLVLALSSGFLFACGTYLVLRRDIVKVIWGLGLVSQGTNVYLLSTGRVGGKAPVVHGATGFFSDPLPQALILTAIVIGLGMTGLSLVLLLRSFEHSDTLDVEEMD